MKWKNCAFAWLFLLGPMWFYAKHGRPDILGGQMLFLYASAMLIVGLFHFNPLVGAFLVLTGAHWFIFEPPFYFEAVLPIACGAMIYDAVARNYRGQSYRGIIAGILAWTLFLSALQRFGMDVLFWQNLEPSGFWTLPSYMGIFAAITAPVMFAWNPWLLLLNLAVLALSKASFAVLACLVGMMPFFSRRLIVVFLVAGLGLVGFSAKDRLSGEWERRLNVWPMMLSTAFRTPFFGAGAGGFQEWMFIEFRGKRAHYFQVKMRPENEEPAKQKILEIAREEGTATDRIETIHFKEPLSPFRNMKEVMDDLRGKPEHPIHGYIWNTHNEYLLLFFGWGLYGLWILWLYCADIVKRYRLESRFEKERCQIKAACPVWDEKRGLFGAFLALLVASFAHFPLEVPRLAIPALFLTALLDGQLIKKGDL